MAPRRVAVSGTSTLCQYLCIYKVVLDVYMYVSLFEALLILFTVWITSSHYNTSSITGARELHMISLMTPVGLHVNALLLTSGLLIFVIILKLTCPTETRNEVNSLR